MTLAILFIPLPGGTDAAARWRRVCAQHCMHHGYEIVSVTGDPAMVQRYLDADAAEVVVVGHPDHARRLSELRPRMEVVTDPPPPHPDQGRTRRRRLMGD